MNLLAGKIHSAHSPFTKLCLLRIIISITAFAWLAGIVSPAFTFPDDHLVLFQPIVKHSYSLVCHQDEAKSFFLNGQKIFVCARCTGIYSAVFLSSLFLMAFNFRFSLNKKLLWISLLIMVVDGLSVITGLYNYNKISAAMTGAFFGSVVFIYISAAIENSIMKKN